MAEQAYELARLWVGTVVYRPYVYVFFLCFLVFAIYHLGLRGMLAFLGCAYAIAFLAEYSSTRNGFPFGIYTYIDRTRDRELWISNVPFWDSLSFVFLAYFSWVVAGMARFRTGFARGLFAPGTAVLGGFLMMLLDVVIDPVALRGDRWFLGKVYFYPQGGSYFGVTLSNFVGWFLVGCVTQLLYGQFARAWRPLWPRRPDPGARFLMGALGVYAGVLAFNLTMTWAIGEYALLAASGAVSTATLTWVVLRLRRQARCVS